MLFNKNEFTVMNCKKNIAVIFAGGIGSRMERSDVPKQFLLLNGKPVIIYTIDLFEQHPDITDIVVVCLESWIERLRQFLNEFKISKVRTIISGGNNTQSSIYNGLCAAEQIATKEDSIVLIHDGVRPLITGQTISDNIETVNRKGSCITCAQPTETIITIKDDGTEVPKRSNLLIARAPQSFILRDIISVHRKAIHDNKLSFIDCCEMMHYYGKSISTVFGPPENIKITTQVDFLVFSALQEFREDKG